MYTLSTIDSLGMWLAEAAGIGTLVTVFLTLISAILLLLGIIWLFVHLFCAYPVYKLAKKAGRKHAWLAFIPIAQYYTIASIGDGPVEIPFIKKKIQNRTAAFWIYIFLPLIFAAIDSILSGIGFIFFLIPFLGVFLWILLIMCSSLLAFLSAFVAALFIYAFYYDIFKLYRPESEYNDTFSVICAICTYLGIPLVCSVLLYTILNRKPQHVLIAEAPAEEPAENAEENTEKTTAPA